MTKEAFLRKLEKLLELTPGSLSGTEELANLPSWDSLALMSFIAMVHREFGVRLSGKQIADCSTVAALVGLLGDKIRG